VIVDMALLTVTIWSFHLEYGQPAAFHLKAPTFTYFFIFVALGREPRGRGDVIGETSTSPCRSSRSTTARRPPRVRGHRRPGQPRREDPEPHHG